MSRRGVVRVVVRTRSVSFPNAIPTVFRAHFSNQRASHPRVRRRSDGARRRRRDVVDGFKRGKIQPVSVHRVVAFGRDDKGWRDARAHRASCLPTTLAAVVLERARARDVVVDDDDAGARDDDDDGDGDFFPNRRRFRGRRRRVASELAVDLFSS